MNLYNSIEETKNNNNNKFNQIKEQILIMQKTLEEDGARRETAHKEFMDFMKKMEDKIFDKFDNELNAKKNIEQTVTSYLEEKFNIVKNEIQNQSKIRYDSIENLEQYFESELPKMQTNLKMEQTKKKQNEVGNKLSDFEIIKELGKGSYGTVYTVKSLLNSNIYVMKKKKESKMKKYL